MDIQVSVEGALRFPLVVVVEEDVVLSIHVEVFVSKAAEEVPAQLIELAFLLIVVAPESVCVCVCVRVCVGGGYTVRFSFFFLIK